MAERVDFAEIQVAGDYGSEFEYDSEADRRRHKDDNLMKKRKRTTDGKPKRREAETEYSREEAKIQRFHIVSMDAFSRHKKFVNDYMLYYGGKKTDFKRDTSRDKTDMDVIRENHQFLWEEDEGESDDSWERRLAKKYFDKLFKEYCITDLSRYKENKVAMRWRTEQEVVDGKGQFICGSRKCCEKEGLRSWEVNFGYLEQGIKKNALVKLRLCPDCSYKLNYHHKKKEILPKKKKGKHKNREDDDNAKRHKTDHHHSEHGSNNEATESPGWSSNTDQSIWSGPAKITEEKSREEEFDDYFNDMFL
ncbi:protein FRA10AC1 homolog isoform X1 [Ylistrum balloti]|uniref:protein FRA10AC1 homolog isoform X1 n=2 Tax=Ylistrum balloti TaxID=509963 RepID=UPI0029059C4A|nr:protein FRA10AC1 homolog isoform X1 [Ylistrum balloti]